MSRNRNRQYRTGRGWSTAKKTVLSAVILLVLFVAGGVIYVKFADGSSKTLLTAADVTPPVDPNPLKKPPKPSPDTAESASIQSFITPVNPGQNTSLSVHTLPKSRCTIAVKYKDIISRDSGLAPRQADDYGNVSWTWTVDTNTPLGTWPATVNCFYNHKSAMVEGELEVTKTPIR